MIPEMTDPMGRYWGQPSKDEILVDENHALMTKATLDRLKDYSRSQPSGVYPGKMWRRKIYRDSDEVEVDAIVDFGWLTAQNRRIVWCGEWALCWFGELTPDKTACFNHCRPVIIV